MNILTRPIFKDEYDMARVVWNTCFPEDATGFSDYYFAERTSAKYVLGAFDATGTMLGALHMLPYPLYFFDKSKPCAMIAGVATLPQYRHQGIASLMINHAHKLLKDQGVCAALLKPDVDFYAQFGYAPFAWQRWYSLPSSAFSSTSDAIITHPSPASLLKIYNNFRQGYNGMMVRTRKYMQLLIKEQNAYGSFSYQSKTAYAAGFVDESDNIILSELVGTNIMPLLASLSREHKSIEFRLPANDGSLGALPYTRQYFNMICVLDEAMLLEALPVNSLSELFSNDAMPINGLEFY